MWARIVLWRRVRNTLLSPFHSQSTQFICIFICGGSGFRWNFNLVDGKKRLQQSVWRKKGAYIWFWFFVYLFFLLTFRFVFICSYSFHFCSLHNCCSTITIACIEPHKLSDYLIILCIQPNENRLGLDCPFADILPQFCLIAYVPFSLSRRKKKQL